MKQVRFDVLENSYIGRYTYEMVLEGDVSDIRHPGQFVELKVSEHFLRRPMSVCDWDSEHGLLTLVYKVVGEGTLALSKYKIGSKIDALTGLGNGFDLSKAGKRPLLVGGGTGFAPLFGLAKELNKIGTRPAVVLGFKDHSQVMYEDKFRRLASKLTICIEDGSRGVDGNVLAGIRSLEDPYSYVYACGPEPMYGAMNKLIKTGAEYDIGSRMGCGFGVCNGCTLKTKSGLKKVCKDGPIFSKEELLWT